MEIVVKDVIMIVELDVLLLVQALALGDVKDAPVVARGPALGVVQQLVAHPAVLDAQKLVLEDVKIMEILVLLFYKIIKRVMLIKKHYP